MASALKSKIASAASSSSTPDLSSQEAEKYKLMVTAGPSYDQSTHRIVRVNTDDATHIENDFLRAKISVNIRSYRGLPSSSPSDSAYFDDPTHDKDLYSISFSFVPKVNLPSVDTVWGNDFDHPIRDRLPPGFNTAFKIVKEFIDPGLQCDAYADEPWLYGPSLSCWFAFRIGDTVGGGDEAAEDFPAPQEGGVMKEGADGTGSDIRKKLHIPDGNDKRRKHFLSTPHREAFTFEKGRCYRGDFYNPYIDFGNFALKLPGFSLKVIKYVDQKSHCLRYVFKNRGTGDIYFNVNFHLLWGEKLERAVEGDGESDRQQGQEHDAAAAVSGPGVREEREAGGGGRVESVNGHDDDDDRQASAGVVDGEEAKEDASERMAPEPDRQAQDGVAEPKAPSLDYEDSVAHSRAHTAASRDAIPETDGPPPQLHADNHAAPAADDGADDEPGRKSAQSEEYHPEDHRRYGNHDRTAPADNSAMAEKGEADGDVDDITKMLVESSTSDRREEKFV
ncbi:hypothetical protein LTR85_011755 [Meristemomyces frigidus]|nr:hypothetical protein LTR85_011755 [Meristemomyces frigidus]